MLIFNRPAELQTNQPCRAWVINHMSDGAIPNPLNRRVNHVQRHQKPLPGFHGLPEAVFDAQVQLRCTEQAVKDVFQTDTVQVMQLVSRHHLYRSQQVGSIFFGACNACLNLAPGHANLVDQLAVFSHKRVAWSWTCPDSTDGLNVLDLLGIFNQIDLTVAVN